MATSRRPASNNSNLRWTSPNYSSTPKIKSPQSPQVPVEVLTGFPARDLNACPSFRSLKDLCTKNNLPEPVAKIVSIGNEKSFTCKMNVGEVVGQDPYFRADRRELALDHASKLLLAKLQDTLKQRKGAMQKHEFKSATQLEQVLERIAKILTLSKNGLWDKKVEEIYSTTYTDKLPENWFEIARGCDLFEVPNPNIRIIELCQGNHDRPMPEFPSSNIWEVIVTAVEDIDKIWINILGTEYSDALFLMSSDISTAVAAGKVKFGMTFVHKDSICLVRNGINFARLKIVEFDGRDNVLGFLIDSGETLTTKLADLAHVPCKYMKIPPQAVTMRLYGLHQFATGDLRFKNLALNLLLNKPFSAIRMGVQELTLHEYGQIDQQPINNLIAEVILSDYLEPQLPNVTAELTVVISHVTDNMELFVQTQPNVVAWLKEQLPIECAQVLQEESPNLVVGQMYLVTMIDDSKSGEFHRASVLRTYQGKMCTMADILLIDYGKTLLAVPEFNIKKFPAASAMDFKNIPPQATICLLYNGGGCSSADELRSKLPANGVVNLRIITPGNQRKPPLVEIYDMPY
ncbi:uncharacterized protein LOC132192864 [Neocloeon triangulifer]|uniref:uncharacterized protein LOC132192864 n=1 Tax=Neocloeon triangulifer TaxID=2078957 RepID=UPI00286F82F5|nr:uncharacterized protein LOC132192864 [Neocloeon triangulifer]